MKLYSHHFHCFSCGRHGDVINLTLLILSCSPIDAARKLVSDFNGNCRIKYAPRTPQDTHHPLFVLSLHELELLRYYQDIFISGGHGERKTFMEKQGELLDRLAATFTTKSSA